MSEQPEVRVGISGWVYPNWRGDFYPTGLRQADELEFASQHLTSIEVNGSFYALQRPANWVRWRDAVPDDFVFAVKGPRFITHIKRLGDIDAPLANFLASGVLALGEKLGPLLWQLPPTFKRDDERLASALERLPPGQRHCFEFRHPSWFADEVYDLLRRHGVALAIGDRPEVRDFQAHVFTADWTLVRFHHGSRGRRGNYSETELREWARRFEDWRADVEIFAYFNNDWEVFAVRNALRLRTLLARL